MHVLHDLNILGLHSKGVLRILRAWSAEACTHRRAAPGVRDRVCWARAAEAGTGVWARKDADIAPISCVTPPAAYLSGRYVCGGKRREA